MAEDTCWVTVTIFQLSNHDVHIPLNSFTWVVVLVALMIHMYATHCNGDLVHKVLVAATLNTKLLDDIHDGKVDNSPTLLSIHVSCILAHYPVIPCEVYKIGKNNTKVLPYQKLKCIPCHISILSGPKCPSHLQL